MKSKHFIYDIGTAIFIVCWKLQYQWRIPSLDV